jgi:hypothetical protein
MGCRFCRKAAAVLSLRNRGIVRAFACKAGFGVISGRIVKEQTMSQLTKKVIAGALVAATLSFSLVTATTPADARGWGHGGWGHGGWGHDGWGRGYGWGGWGWGLGGLALGAALAYPYYGYGYPCGPYGYHYGCYAYGYGYPYYPYW